MHHWHLPALKQLLNLVDRHAGHVGVQADEAGNEVDARGGQVHDVVAEDARLCEGLEGRGFHFWWVGAREFGLGHDVD